MFTEPTTTIGPRAAAIGVTSLHAAGGSGRRRPYRPPHPSTRRGAGACPVGSPPHLSRPGANLRIGAAGGPPGAWPSVDG
ncbi:hypothetical protein GCM10011594_04110 [Nakamurella endophytica]|uniref:Uncharacterized protein n=1 Tax=Nakamurella endophytica TaxID=1748367 RepID=A0A917SMJ1_9ACTN|nr:hypothetical protein GCM10011594_04110 [Nakamurella endophytica]